MTSNGHANTEGGEDAVIIIGGGLAGLVTAYEITRANRKVIIVDQEPENYIGGQAFWSIGGLLFVNSPEQRRLGIRDSKELALQDWLNSAKFTNTEKEEVIIGQNNGPKILSILQQENFVIMLGNWDWVFSHLLDGQKEVMVKQVVMEIVYLDFIQRGEWVQK